MTISPGLAGEGSLAARGIDGTTSAEASDASLCGGSRHSRSVAAAVVAQLSGPCAALASASPKTVVESLHSSWRSLPVVIVKIPLRDLPDGNRHRWLPIGYRRVRPQAVVRISARSC